MTTTNLNTASTVAPRVLVSQYVPTTGATQYEAVVGTTTQITTAFVTNTDSVARTVKLIIVKAGGTAGATPPLLPTISLAAGATLDLGKIFLGDGDFVWAEASSASKVGICLTGIEFSNATGGALSGIQDDAIGTGGHGAGTVTGTNKTGTAANRYLFGSLLAAEAGGAGAGWSTYSTLTMSCTDGAMTRLASVDFNNGFGIAGSVHLFGRPNCTSGSTQTLTGTVAASGVTFASVLGSFSKSGVASVTGPATSGPVGAAVLGLPITSAVGHVPVFAGVFYGTPQDFNLRTRYFNGVTSGFTIPQWLLMADAIGAATVTATLSNSTQHAAVGIDVVPA